MAGVQPLDVGATVDEREQARRTAGRDAERVGNLDRRQIEQPCRGGGGAEHAGRAGRMKAALAEIGMAGTGDG
ncbi:MAG: hypothetical protein WDN48_15870 [Pseudolabrys sp.]